MEKISKKTEQANQEGLKLKRIGNHFVWVKDSSSSSNHSTCRNCGRSFPSLKNHESICRAKRYSHGYRGQGYSGNNGQGRFHDS